MLLFIPFIVTSVYCLVASSWSIAPRYDLSTTFRNLISRDKVAFNDFTSSFSKRTDPAPTDVNLNAYLARAPHNQIPDYVTVNRNQDGGQSEIFSQAEIWAALNAGVQQYNRWIVNPNDVVNPRLSFTGPGNRYPHPITGREQAIQDINIGDATRPLWIWPLRHQSYNRAAIWGGGNDNPGLDRVVFDGNGYYVGVVTHRGESDNEFHFGSPTDSSSRALAAVDLTNIPGVPVHTTYNGPTLGNAVLGGYIDAAAPPSSPWNVLGPGGGISGFGGSGL